MNLDEIKYIRRRQAILREQLVIAENSFKLKKIGKRQMMKTQSSITSRISELQKLVNISEILNGEN